MKKLLGNPWFLLILLTIMGGGAVALMEARSTTVNHICAGAIFGGSLGVANVVDFSLSRNKWMGSFVNAAVGALSGVAISWILGKSNQTMMLYLLAGAILGLTVRYWLKYVNF